MSLERSISSLQHPLVKHLVKLRNDSHYRDQQRSLVLEGFKPIQEVHTRVKKLLCTPSMVLRIDFKAAEMWTVSDQVIEKISGMKQAEGIVAEVEMPVYDSLHEYSLLLALDGINDPGNLGTLLRTALAFGWEGCYILENSCDPYNEKVIRAARGAHFKLPFQKVSAQHLQQMALERNFQCLAADTTGTHFETLSPSTSPRLLILGNEAHGPSETIRQFCTPITIPMSGNMESLNVACAGAILLYYLNSQNRSFRL